MPLTSLRSDRIWQVRFQCVDLGRGCRRLLVNVHVNFNKGDCNLCLQGRTTAIQMTYRIDVHSLQNDAHGLSGVMARLSTFPRV